MKLEKNYKVRVTPEQSRQIQELLFVLGGGWFGGHDGKEPMMLDADYLFLHDSMVLTYAHELGDCYFENKHNHTEIQADDLITLLTDLSKSAENPLQNMKPTPEFETEASEPKFKAGDKVYLGLTGKIAQVTEIIDDEVVSVANKNNEFRAWISNICHATPENYERLQATFPGIKYEQPPKELAGSDLAKALIEKGWVGFNCLCGRIGDENAITETIVTGINNDGQFTTIDGQLFNHAIPMKGWRPLKAREVGL